MGWEDIRKRTDDRIVSECRAGILVGHRVDVSDSSQASLALLDGLNQHLWIVDDLCGLAPEQPIFVGEIVAQAFGLDGDHRMGIQPAELGKKIKAAEARQKLQRATVDAVLKPFNKKAGALGAWFVWSGPLCGGFLVKGVWRDEFAEDELYFASNADCRIYTASRGARQDPAPGGVYGVALFRASYDNSNQPPLLNRKLLIGGDAKLKKAGLLDKARLFVLPHYD